MKNLDFLFKNSLAKVIANNNYPELKLAGLSIGPFQEGNEYEVYQWISEELEKEGIVHFREEEMLDSTKLAKVQWKERIQVPGQISELPQDFYPKLRKYLERLKQEITIQPQKINEYERVRSLAMDIITSRLKKIISLSSGPSQSDQIVQKLTTEEKLIYIQLGRIISQWRTTIIEQDR